MINLKTGKLETRATGNNLWHTEDSICIESSTGFTCVAATREVRLIIAKFLEDTYLAWKQDFKNTDVDFSLGKYEYRLAIEENSPEDKVIIYLICLPTWITLVIDVEVLPLVAMYLKEEQGEDGE